MPLITGVDHDNRTVGVVAIGTVTLSDVRDHWLHKRRERSLNYPELADVRGAAVPFTASDMQHIAEIVRELSSEGPLGRVAIIVSSEAAAVSGPVLEALAQDVCEIKIFRDEEAARTWVHDTPAETTSK